MRPASLELRQRVVRHGVVVVRLHESLNLVKEEVRVDRDGLKEKSQMGSGMLRVREGRRP